jgi:hypothetical protein
LWFRIPPEPREYGFKNIHRITNYEKHTMALIKKQSNICYFFRRIGPVKTKNPNAVQDGYPDLHSDFQLAPAGRYGAADSTI